MKTLVIGDIHGNLIALERVLQDYLKEVDQVVCHGDVVNYGPWSNECVELLESINCVCLLGNHEEAFINGKYEGPNKLVKRFFKKTFTDFTHLDQIKKYKKIFKVDDYEIIHTINNQYYYPDSDLDALDLKMNTIIGHSHYAFHRILKNGNTLTNTGSVGQNRINLSLINFVILDSRRNQIQIKEISYDPFPVIQKMKSMDYPVECVEYYENKIIK